VGKVRGVAVLGMYIHNVDMYKLSAFASKGEGEIKDMDYSTLFMKNRTAPFSEHKRHMMI
jgi:hypothetical protein